MFSFANCPLNLGCNVLFQPFRRHCRENKFQYLFFMKNEDIITIDKDIAGGQPVFKGTRVPVEIQFDHLEAGVSLDDFLEDFLTVSKEQAVAVLNRAQQFILSQKVA